MAKTISIIDDDKAMLDVVQVLLEDEGYSVLTYTKSSDFLKALHTSNTDIVILDNTIGITSGKNLADEVKKYVSIPVLMISGQSDVIHHPTIDAFIKKPFSIDLLLNTVQKYLT